MPSQTTMTLGSSAPGSRVRPDHPTPVPLPPLPIYCEQGEIANLTSCTPPWMRLGVTYLRPRLAPPQPTLVRPAIPWLMIVAVAALAAVIAIAAAHLLSIAAEVHTVDSALASHATELAPIDRRTPEPRAKVPSPPEAPPVAEPPPEVEPPPLPASFPRASQPLVPTAGWRQPAQSAVALALEPPGARKCWTSPPVRHDGPVAHALQFP